MYWQCRTVGEDFPAFFEEVFDRRQRAEHDDSLPKYLKIQNVACSGKGKNLVSVKGTPGREEVAQTVFLRHLCVSGPLRLLG